MVKTKDQKKFEEFSNILNGDTSLEERISNLISRVKKQNFRPYLCDLFNILKEEEDLLVSSYNSLSDEIKLKISKFMDEINDLRLKHLKIEIDLSGLEGNFDKYKDLYSTVLVDDSLKNNAEYEKFLKLYEGMNKLSSDILVKKQEVGKLLNLQKILDFNFSSEIIDIEYLVAKINLLINNFGSFKTTPLLKTYISKFSKNSELERLIISKEERFSEAENFIRSNADSDSLILDKDGFLNMDKFSSLKVQKVTKDLFISEN